MKTKTLLLSVLYIFLSFGTFAQTGPAGIGNSDGSNGHPRNLIWLDASDLTGFSTGDTWADKSGNGHNAVSDGADISLGDINGENALDFSSFTGGNFSIAHHADFNDISELSFFVVYNSGTSTNPQGLVSKRTDTGDASFALFQHDNYRLRADYSDKRINGSNNSAETNYIANYIFQTDDSLKIYKNGVLDNGAWMLSGSSNTNNTSVNIEIGKLDENYSDNNNFKGKIAEIIVYKNNLAPIQRALVVSYLSSKYGISVNEINIAYSPSSGDFYNDLTAYGRSSSGFKDFGASAGVYISLNDASVDDYITAGHNGEVNTKENIKTGSDVTSSGASAAWNRDWYIEKGGSSEAVISFSLPEGIEDGSFPQELDNYVLLRKDTPAGNFSQVSLNDKRIELGERIKFEVADVDFQNGYYTLGTLDQSASPLEGGSIRTWYTLISGDWDNEEVWTLDPSGALPNNPNGYTPATSPTGSSDKVVVLNGKRVTLSENNKQASRLTVDGSLDLQSTTGHSFGQIRGKGRILLSNDNFPDGDATHFVSSGQGEGTVVYYGDSDNITQALSFFDLEINLSDVSEKITLLNDITINGDFRVKNGEFQFNDASQTNSLNVNVQGDVIVEENGKILTGGADARHQFNMYGDFTNNGTVEFTNRVAPDYSNEATDGIVDINFLNDNKNQLAFFNGPSKIYRIEIDKGTDDTYELILEASSEDNFELLGYSGDGHSETAQLTSNSNALGLLRGTVRIKSNIDVPQLNNSGNYNISEAARLWVDGGYVAKTSGTAIVPYGEIQVSSGTLESLVSSGITTRGNALVRVKGGTLNINQLRTSTLGSNNIGGYVQSGGTTNILGGDTSTDYYCFNLTYPGNVFNMSGGTLHIHEAHGRGGVFIASDETNQNVTGGTVIMEISDGNDFEITSRAPFWNVIIRNSHSGNGKHLLSGGTDVGATNESLPVQDLHVLNDLTIETGTTRSDGTNTYGSYLDLVPDNTNPANLYVGGNLTIEDSGVLDIWALNGSSNVNSATVTFNGTEDGVLYIGDITTYNNSFVGFDGGKAYGNWEHPFYNFTVDKPGATLSLAAKDPGKGTYPGGNYAKHAGGGKNVTSYASNLIRVTNEFKLLSGTLDQIDPLSTVTYDASGTGEFGLVGDPVGYSIRLFGTDVVNKGTLFTYQDGVTPKEGIIVFRNGGGDITLNTTEGASFGNMRMLVSSSEKVTTTSDVAVGRLEMAGGLMDIGTYNLKVDVFEFLPTSTPQVAGGARIFNASNMIRMAGNASDGGLSIKVPRSVSPISAIDEFEVLDPSGRQNWARPYNQTDRIWFPVGTAGKYTPAICHQHNNGTTDGDEYITVRVVDQALQTTDLSGGDILSYYWNVDFEGYDQGEEPAVSWIFQYDDLDAGGLDETAFVPGKVLNGGDYARSDEGGTSAVKDGGSSTNEGDILGNDPRNIIVFNGVGSSSSTISDDDIETATPELYDGNTINTQWENAWPNAGFALEKANYTAGVPNRFTGDVEVYYSIATNISDCNWNDGSNWARNDNLDPSYENHDSRQPDAGDYPQEGDVAVIGWCPWDDGNGNIDPGDPHLIRLTTDIECAQLIFTPMEDALGNPRAREPRYASVFRPCLGIYSGRNLTTGLVEGEGMFWCKSSDPDFTLMDLGEFAVSDSSYILYENYNASRTYVNMPSESPNLMITSDSWGRNDRTTIIATDIKTNGSFEIIGDANVELDTDATGDITIGGNLMISEVTDPDAGTPSGGGGEIRFQNSGNPRNITVGGDILLNNTSNRIYVQNAGGNNIAHQISVEGNITQSESGDGLLFSTGIGNDHIDLTLIGNGSNSFDITAGNIPEFHRIILNKGTDQTSSFNFNGDFNLNGPTSGVNVDKAIELQNGTLILNHSDINVDLTTGDDDFYIPGTAGLEVRQGQVNAYGGSGILLDGKLDVSGGTVDMSGGDNYIQYSASGNAAINVSAGELIVGSQIRRGLTSSEGILDYTQTGGTVIVGNDVAPKSNRGVIEILNDGSNFTFTGGELQVVRAQNNPSFASVYLKPETSTLDAASLLKIGNSDTPANQEVGIYSNLEIPNLLVSNESGNSPLLRQWTVPLTIGSSLEIESGATFDANGDSLTLKGDLISNGQFIANENSTFISGATDQNITGSVDFYNLTKTSSTLLNLNNNISVANELKHENGVLADNGNIVSVNGNIHFHGDHQWGGSGRGIVLSGFQEQTLYGSGTFGKLTINNPEGVSVADENDVFVDGALQMEQGVFNVGANLLTIGKNAIIVEENPFSETNMIQTNVSFTDNGVKKYFSDGAVNFTYPVGSTGRYTPVTLNITDNSSDIGSLLVKPAAEAHTSVTDKDNALQYHWLLRAEDLSDFSADAFMKYDIADVKGDIDQYITARLLFGGDGDWNKFSGDDIDQAERKLKFSFIGTDDSGISGDYTAGLDAAIPDQVPTYITTQSGNYSDAGIWENISDGGGTVPAGGPRGSMVIIAHEVDVPLNYTSAYRTTINETGTLSMGSSYGHRLGEVAGEGRLKLESGNMPAGVYAEFLHSGTIEYTGSSSYDVLSGFGEVSNLVFSGTGDRSLPNIPLQVNGDIELNGPSLINQYSRTMFLQGDFVFDDGSFDAGTGDDACLVLNGTEQQLIGGMVNFSDENKFNHLEVNNSAGVLVQSDVEIENSLTLSNGVVNNTLGNKFALLSYASGSVSGGSASSYVSGPFEKKLNSNSSFVFPIGDKGRYGEVELSETGTTGAAIWEARYYNHNPANDGFDTNSTDGDIEFVSTNEYWCIKAPESTEANVKVWWDSQSGISADASEREDLRIVSWEDLSPAAWLEAGADINDNGQNDGTIKTSGTRSFNNFAQGNYYTIGGVAVYSYPWKGLTDEWSDPDNWDTGKKPSMSTEVTIPETPVGGNYPVINGDAYCMDLIINAGATVTVKSESTLEIGNYLDNNGTIIFDTDFGKAPAAMIPPIDNTDAGEGDFYINNLPGNAWIKLGHPVKSPKASIYNVGGTVEVDSWIYRVFNGWQQITDPNLDIKEMGGINVWYAPKNDSTNYDLHYNGTINTDQAIYEVEGGGYYLLGNPFTSAIDWQKEDGNGWDRTSNVGPTMWQRVHVGDDISDYEFAYNRSTGVPQIIPEEYGFTEENVSHIAPFQSVWIYVDDKAPAHVQVDNKARVRSDLPLKRASSEAKSYDIIRVKTKRTNQFLDGTVLYFDETFDSGIDYSDSEKKLNSTEGYPEVFTKAAGKRLGINGMPALSEEHHAFPLVVRNRVEGTVSMRFTLDQFNAGYEVFLEDKEKGSWTNVKMLSEYHYSPTELGMNEDRFVIHLQKVRKVPTNIDEQLQNENGEGIEINGYENYAHVNISDALLQSSQATIELLDASGRLILSRKTANKETEITLPEPKGVYIVRVKAGGAVKTAKVLRR